MKISIILFLIGVFFNFKGVAYYCHVDENIAEQWERLNKIHISTDCCEISDKQWELIKWYFLRVGSFLSVTEIVREIAFTTQTHYMNHFVEDLYRYTGLKYYTHQIMYKISEEQANKEDIFDDNTYQWHPELSEDGNSTYYVEDGKLNIRSQILKKNWIREDEPDSGIVVLATNIEIIDNFLSDKHSKHPFHSKRSHYIILIYREIRHDWDQLASSILAKLWKVHGILNAIVMASCKQNNVGILDQFANTRQLNITDPNVAEWGIYRCFPTKYLDYTDSWLVQKEYNLNGFPLTFSIFERYPTMVNFVPKYFANTHYAKGMKISGYGGIDGLLLGNAALDMEFTVKTIMPQENGTYGYKWNGKFYGAIGDVLYGRADIAFNSRFLINYDTNDIEYMFPILGDKLCVIMPASKKPPKWTVIFKCFDIYLWTTFFVITAMSSVIFAILKYYQEKLERRVLRDSFLYKDFKHLVVEEKIKVKDIFYATWRVMMGMNAAMPFGTIERLLIGSCILTNIIISGSFESSLYTAYTRTTRKDINTLREVDDTGLRIASASPSLRNTFGNNQTRSNILRSLNDKLFFEFSGQNSLERVAEYGDVCSIERLSDVHIIIKTRYLDEDGSSKLHVVKECPRHYFLTYIAYKDWPFLSRFNKILQRFAEGGFSLLWYEETVEAFIRHSYVHHQEHPDKSHRHPFSMTDIQAPFYMLIFGYTISIIVFLIEKFVLTPKNYRKLQNLISPVKSITRDFELSRRKKFRKFAN